MIFPARLACIGWSFCLFLLTTLDLPQAAAAEQANELVALDGARHRIFGNRDVKAAVLIFIMPDCPIVNSYAPEFNRLHSEFAPQGVPVLLVHVDADVTNDAARRHAQEYRLECPIVMDREQAWVRRAAASKTPEAAVFSPDGELQYLGWIDNRYAALGKRRNEATSADLRTALNEVLAGKPVTNSRTEVIGCPIPKVAAKVSD